MSVFRNPTRLVPLGLLLVCSFLFLAPTAHAATEGRIVFYSNRDGYYNTEIYVMNADGTGVTRLTDNPSSDEDPAFSPDGSKIAFRSLRDGNSEIYVMNADGTGVTRLTDYAGVDSEPAFSPDGSKIAFRSNRDGSIDIYVMNADGTGVTRLTDSAATDESPVFSPDGSKIAFTSYRDGNFEIYVMNADGTGQVNLTNSGGGEQSPAFSPDGSKIAFTGIRGIPSDPNWEIYVMNADGTGVTRLTENADYDGTPAFSPDGSKIAFHSTRDGNAEIYAMNADGTGQINLTNNAAGDLCPSWGGPAAPVFDDPPSGIHIEFPPGTIPGVTTVTPTSPGGGPPSGFRFVGNSACFDITSTAVLPPGTAATITIPYVEGDVNGQEGNIKVQYWDGNWHDVTPISIDEGFNTVTFQTSHLSIYALVEPLSEPVDTPASSPWSLVLIAAFGLGAVLVVRCVRATA